jgi:hypothetical protein
MTKKIANFERDQAPIGVVSKLLDELEAHTEGNRNHWTYKNVVLRTIITI